ncbi:PCI domain-containing protein [Psidium guajava]|nr:PCI domain-containing protein [Psidium guajava]
MSPLAEQADESMAAVSRGCSEPILSDSPFDSYLKFPVSLDVSFVLESIRSPMLAVFSAFLVLFPLDFMISCELPYAMFGSNTCGSIRDSMLQTGDVSIPSHYLSLTLFPGNKFLVLNCM